MLDRATGKILRRFPLPEIPALTSGASPALPPSPATWSSYRRFRAGDGVSGGVLSFEPKRGGESSADRPQALASPPPVQGDRMDPVPHGIPLFNAGDDREVDMDGGQP